MIVYLDRAFCVSPDCVGACGRQLTDEIRAGAKAKRLPLSLGYFCGPPAWTFQRDDDIVRRAELWATGATIHDVKGLIGLYRSAVFILDKGPKDEEQRRRAEDYGETARRRLEAFMAHGDYRRATRENPFQLFSE